MALPVDNDLNGIIRSQVVDEVYGTAQLSDCFIDVRTGSGPLAIYTPTQSRLGVRTILCLNQEHGLLRGHEHVYGLSSIDRANRIQVDVVTNEWAMHSGS